ncbi:MAG: hypothetical protein RL538_157 [Candidatus Parcubacteria bacterium]|jgi:hypothetical protein
MKDYISTTLILLTLITALFVWQNESTEKLNSLKFSNTQTWDETLLKASLEKTVIVEAAYGKMHLPEAPINKSSTTRRELEDLHMMVSLRTPEILERINAEQKLVGSVMGPYTYAEIISTSTHPHTSFFIQKPLYELSVLTMRFKKRFDRVRPSYLDTSLTTAITVPEHPAYPSGHSTQAHFIALLMSELDPEHRDAYWESAERIAKGREIAGVHYPSDSEAGKILAQQYFALLQKTPWYQTYFKLAKGEWE